MLGKKKTERIKVLLTQSVCQLGITHCHPTPLSLHVSMVGQWFLALEERAKAVLKSCPGSVGKRSKSSENRVDNPLGQGQRGHRQSFY